MSRCIFSLSGTIIHMGRSGGFQPPSANSRRLEAAAVRLRAHGIGRVKVPINVSSLDIVAEGNCVVARRGGEQPEANDWSVG